MASWGLQEMFSSTILLGLYNVQEMFSYTILLGVDGNSVVLHTQNSYCSCWFLILSSGVVNRTLSQTWKIILTNVPVEGGVVESYINGLFDGSSKLCSLPSMWKSSSNVLLPVLDLCLYRWVLLKVNFLGA